MKKNNLFTLIRIFVSLFFIFLIIRKTDFKLIYGIIKNADLFLLFPSFILIFLINLPLALRFKYILEIYFKKNLPFPLIFKLTMIGIFFNNFLPTSAGGDIVKIFYVVKDEKNKFLSGISVLIDRYIGALTVMTMGLISIFFYKSDDKINYLIIGLFLLLLFSFYFFSYRKFASFFYSPFKKIFPEFINEKILQLYNSINFYFTERRKNFYIAILISFLLQILTIFSQYLIGISIVKKNLSILPFFIYIPLIWTSTLIPSIGGLGVREFSYIFLFSNFIGKENSYALSILVLLSIILNGIVGGIIFLTFKGEKI